MMYIPVLHSFIFNYCINSVQSIWIDHNLSILLLTNNRDISSYFAITNDTAMKSLKHRSWYTYIRASLNCIPEVELHAHFQNILFFSLNFNCF